MTHMQVKRRARDTRTAARNSLKPHYWLAVLACLIAAILGVASLSSISLTYNTSEEDAALPPLQEEIENGVTWEEVSDRLTEISNTITEMLLDIPPVVWGVISVIAIFSLLLSIAYVWVGYCVRLGLCRFHLSLTDGERPSIGMLFSYFGQAFWRSVGMNILRNLIALLAQLPALAAFLMSFGVIGHGLAELWGTPELTDEVAAYIFTLLGQFTLLFLIAFILLFLTLPIVLRYSMADYVLAENPEVGAVGALRESARMMKGNKWRLFCLRLSFFGWHFLALLTGGLGYLFLNPYTEQATTEFYHEISGRAAVREAVENLDPLIQDF